MDEVLKRLMANLATAKENRDRSVEQRKAIVESAKTELREDLNDAEDAEFRKLTETIRVLDDQINKYDERIAELADEDKRSAKANEATRRVRQIITAADVREQRTYERGNGNSYLKDLAQAQIYGSNEARERLARHSEEVRTEPEYTEFRDLNRADGSGGFFVPPSWLMGSWIELARAGRPTANLITTQPLPPGTDSINIPRVVTGSTTAVQPADNDPVSETDMTDSSLSIPVRTIAGQQDIAIQLLDQSPVNFDEIVFRDLLADYALKTNLQVLGGTGAAGQVLGLGSQTGVTAVTVADTTIGALYRAIANATQQIYSTRFATPNVIVMHPRRWAALVSSLDTQSRPLVVPAAQGPMNAIGTFGGVAQQQVVGSIQGLPVVTDPSIPTNRGVGTNEDVIYLLRTDDLVLYESGVRTRVLQETLSGTLTVRLQVYGYVAFSAGRYAQSTARLTGAGLVAPTF